MAVLCLVLAGPAAPAIGGTATAEPTGLELTLPDLASAAEYLPSVEAVTVTVAADGRCTAKRIRPGASILEARLVGTARGQPPSSVEFVITPSALVGTAVNEDCELNAVPDPDFSIGVPEIGVLRADASETAPGSGRYRTVLYAYDWGGSVTIAVSGEIARADGGARLVVRGRLVVPVDTDGDRLPDVYERNSVAGVDNRDRSGRNVLDADDGDQDDNGIADGEDRFARDGLTNFEKYRGVYLVGPAGGRSGDLTRHVRLGAAMRHLFVRGRGFAGDPSLLAHPLACGLDTSNSDPARWVTARNVPPPALDPCPPFTLTPAFREAGVEAHDVSASFTEATVFPMRSLHPGRPRDTPALDLATVVYDAANCFGGEDCDNADKTGVQWEYPTVGFSTFGTTSRYGVMIRVFKRAVDAHFTIPAAVDPAADAGPAETTPRERLIATKHALVRWAITHELGHGVGVTRHSDDALDIMFRHATPEGLDGRFLQSPGLIRIHNRGVE